MRILFFIVFLFCSPFAYAGLFDNWAFSKLVEIDYSAGDQMLEGYQLRLELDTAELIALGQLNSDGSDLRFANSDFSTEYCYWIESGLNTDQTIIWVRVDEIPAKTISGMRMLFGNPSAVNISNPDCVFDLYEDFSSDLGAFQAADCGSNAYLSTDLINGRLEMQWKHSGTLISDTSFPASKAFIAEMNVLETRGRAASLFWTTDTPQPRSYSLTVKNNDREMGIARSLKLADDFCPPKRFVARPTGITNTAGVWSFAWPENGVQIAEFPGVGRITTRDDAYKRVTDLRLMFGSYRVTGGGMDVGWVRVRQYADVIPGVRTDTSPPTQSLPPVPLGSVWWLLSISVLVLGLYRLKI